MNQTSDKFFDEMLKDNMPAETAGSFQEQLADMIDKRISESMRKFEEQFSQISQPAADPAEAAKDATKRDETRLNATEQDQIIRPEEATPGVDSTIENK